MPDCQQFEVSSAQLSIGHCRPFRLIRIRATFSITRFYANLMPTTDCSNRLNKDLNRKCGVIGTTCVTSLVRVASSSLFRPPALHRIRFSSTVRVRIFRKSNLGSIYYFLLELSAWEHLFENSRLQFEPCRSLREFAEMFKRKSTANR